MRDVTFRRIFNLAFISVFTIFVLLEIIILKTPPAKGYEISIYAVYPSFFWGLIILSVTVIWVILMYCSITTKMDRREVIFLPVFAMIVVKMILLLLPLFRGYLFYGRADTVYHLSYIKEIVKTKEYVIEQTHNYYPHIHMLGALIYYLTGYSIYELPIILVLTFNLLYILGFVILSRAIGLNSAIAVLFILPFQFSFYHTNVLPSFFALYTVPMILYLYHKKTICKNEINKHTTNINRISLITTIFLIALVFLHPATTFYFILTLVAFALTAKFVYRTNTDVKTTLNYILLASIVLVGWYFSFSRLQNDFRRVFYWFIGIYNKPSVVEYQLNILSRAELPFLLVLDVLIKRYGVAVIYLIISLACVVYYLYKILVKEDKNNNKISLSYFLAFVIVSATSSLQLFAYLLEYSPIRVMRFSIFIGTILSILILTKFVSPQNLRFQLTKKLAIYITIFLLIYISTIISIFNIYQSPLINVRNGQVTLMEVNGLEWLSKNKDENTYVQSHVGTFFKAYLVFAEVGRSTMSKEAIRKINSIYIETPIPTHFGYESNSSIVQTVNYRSEYLIMSKRGLVDYLNYPKEVWHLVRQYTAQDFIKLNLDITNKIYVGKDFNIYKIL